MVERMLQNRRTHNVTNQSNTSQSNNMLPQPSTTNHEITGESSYSPPSHQNYQQAHSKDFVAEGPIALNNNLVYA